MSSTKEIQEVYEDEINQKSYLVERKFGKKPFYEGFDGMQIRKNTDYDTTQVKDQGTKQMPLKRGSSNSEISSNIRELWDANDNKKKKRSKAQIVAIAMSVAGRKKK